MELRIQCLSGESLEIQAPLQWTWRDLKVHIKSEWGIDERQQRLAYGSTLLDGSTKVVDDLRQLAPDADGLALTLYKKSPAFVSALEAVQKDGLELQGLSEELKADREIVLPAVKQNAAAIWFAQDFRKDPEVMLAVAQQAQYADPALEEDFSQWSKRQQMSNALRAASEELLCCRSFVLAAVQRNGHALGFAEEALRGDRELVKVAVLKNGWALQYASKELQADKDLVLEALQSVGLALQFASDALRRDPETVAAAVRRMPEAVAYAEEVTTETLLEAVTQEGMLLHYASASQRQDKALVLAAVKRDPDALDYASEDLQKDPEILEACRMGRSG